MLRLFASFFPPRLKGCEQDVEIWQRVLSVRSLVLTPSQDKDMWIKFANLCRKSDRLGLAEKTLSSLLGPQESGDGDGVSGSMHLFLLIKVDKLWTFTGSSSTSSRCLRLLQIHLGSRLQARNVDVATVVHRQAYFGSRI